MCTAVFDKNNRLFGRTLDLEYHYSEEVTVTPRGAKFSLRLGEPFACRFAIIGMATVRGGYPLYYDAMNEKGLAIAGLNFPKSARYFEKKDEKPTAEAKDFALENKSNMWDSIKNEPTPEPEPIPDDDELDVPPSLRERFKKKKK